MSDIIVTIVLPNGGARRAEVPDDVPVRDLIAEFTSLLNLPTVGPDGRPMGYRIDSKALGRELQEQETLAQAGVKADDRLMLTADITAGAGSSIEDSPRMRRLRGDFKLIQEIAARSDVIQIQTESVREGLPPEKYVVTFKTKGIIGVELNGTPKYGDKHQVEIYLHAQYPQRWPGLKWLTPIWHPNINHLNGSVCIDAAWWSASRSLDRLVIMLGEMVQYKNFHDDPTKPPFPWDPEAARWCRDYRSKHPNSFPVDTIELLRPERVKMNTGEPQKQPARKTPLIKAVTQAPKAPTAVKLAPVAQGASKDGAKAKIKLGGSTEKTRPTAGAKSVPSSSGRMKIKPVAASQQKPAKAVNNKIKPASPKEPKPRIRLK